MKLEKILTNAADFRAKFSRNMEIVKKSDEYVVKLEPVEFDFANSKIKRMSRRGGDVFENSYLDVAMWHPNYI